MEVRRIAGQNNNAAGWISLHGIAVELLARTHCATAPDCASNQLGIQGDRRIEHLGDRTVLLGIAGHSNKRGFIQVGHLRAQRKRGRLMRKPWPSGSSVTAASVVSSVGV